MPYVYECDGFCEGDPSETRPMLTAEFNEHRYDNEPIGDLLRQHGYEPGDLVTLCPGCTIELLIES